MKRVIEKFGFNESHVDIIKKAIKAATNGHNETNHMYGDASYTTHLSHVVDVAYRFIHLVPIKFRPVVIAACWLHDSIEDARLSYNDILKIFKDEPHEVAVMIAEIVRAVTNYTRGRNRDERMPDFIYKEIRDTYLAIFVKFCDRIANIEAGGKVHMYEKEHSHFKTMLWNNEYVIMLEYMELLYEMAPKAKPRPV